MNNLHDRFQMSQMMADSLNHDMKERIIESMIEKYMSDLKDCIEKEVRSEVEKYANATVDEIRGFMKCVDEYQVRISYEQRWSDKDE